MKALIGSLLLVTLSSVATAEDSFPRKWERSGFSTVPPSSPVLSSPPLSGWNINVVDAIEVGITYSMLIDGDIAYLGYHRMLTVVDIADPTSPQKIGFVFLIEGACYEIRKSGHYLYCAVSNYPNNYLQIVDVSNPAEPAVVTTMATQGWEIDVNDGYLYISHGNGVRVYDIANPAAPVLKGFCASDNPTDILARDGYVYVARGVSTVPALQIIDATVPTNPIQTALITVGSSPYNLAIAGSYLYVSGFFGSFNVVDISIPTTPVVVATRPGPFLDVVVYGNHAYLIRDEGIQPYDITNPLNPIAKPLFVPCDVWYPNPLELGDGLLAVGDDGGVCFVDISNPNALTELGSYDAVPTAYSVDIAGAQVAVSMHGHLMMMNRYDPSIRHVAEGHGFAIDNSHVVVQDNYAYMSMDDSNYNSGDGLEIFDISDPTNPHSVGHMFTPWFPSPLAVGDGFVYLATSEGLWVVDVSNPAAPVKVGELAVQFYDVFAAEPYLFAINQDHFRVLDISNPSLPVVATSLPLPSASSLWVQGTFAYVASNDNGLQIVDVSQPMQPSVAGHFSTDELWYVCVRDNYAYLTERGFIRIVDVSNPLLPVEVGNIATFEFGSRVAVAPPYIYAPAWGPLLVLETPLITNIPDTPGTGFALQQNYPNPFNPSTTIAFQLPSTTRARIDVFDVRGQLVRTLTNESMSAGPHSIAWDGRDAGGVSVGSGIYFYRLTADGKTEAKKMVLLK